MDKQRIVITGIGVVAPNGIGKEEFWRNCAAGVSGIKPITLFDTSRYRCHHAGEISNFQPEQYLGPKGLRNLDRTTLLALVAAKLAIEDAKFEITEQNTHDVGVVLGSTMGSVHSISTFDIESLREGPRYVNPALFPNTVINSPASHISIRFGIKGLNATIGNGFTASLNALEYAIDMLRLGRVKTIVVGGVEELCPETFAGLAALRPETVLGEGAGMFVIESEESAISRAAPAYGDILEVVSAFDPVAASRCRMTEEGATSTVYQALESSHTQPGLIDWISGWGEQSSEEATVLADTLGSRATTAPRCSVRELVGECFSASGALQLAAALGRDDNKNTIGLLCHFSPIGINVAAVLQAGRPMSRKRRAARSRLALSAVT